MNTKGMKFLAVLAVLAMAFAAIAVLDVQQKGAVEGDAVDVAKIGDTGYKTLEEAIAAATGESTEIVLLMDVTATLTDFTQDEGASEKTIAIDLAGYTLTLGNTDGILIENGVKLIFNNGKILANNMPNGTKGVFCPQTGSSVEINKVTFDTNGTAFYPRGDAAKVVIEDSEVTAGTYAVGTNAATLDNYGVEIIINKSTLISTCYADDDGDTCTVMLNVAGSLNITDSTINGKRQAVFVRAGDAVLENVNVEFEPNFATPGKYKPDDTWKSGNEVPEAAIVIGNDRDSAFKADANVTLNNVAVTIKQNEDVSKQCFDVLWIVDYKKTEEETTVDTYKTNVNIDNLTVPATGIVTIKAGTVNETNITAEGLTAGDKGMTISNGSVVLSGDIDGGAITGDVTIKDANILGDLTLNGNITIDGKVNIGEGVDVTPEGETRIKFAVPESEDDGLVFLTGNVTKEAIAAMDLPIISGSSDNNLRELGCPVIVVEGDLYIMFKVKFGSEKSAAYGVWYNGINYTGEEITTSQIQQSVISIAENAIGSFHDLSKIQAPGKDVGIYTYPNTANFTYQNSSVPLSVIVPYEIVPAPSDSLFVEKSMTIGEKTVGSTKITQPTEQNHYLVTFDSVVNYIPATGEFNAGYYVAFGLTQLDGTAIPAGAEVKIDGEAIPQIDGVYYICLGEGVQTGTPISVKVVVDYDTTEVANFKTANYDVTIIPTTVNLVSFAVADDKVDYWQASTIEKPEIHDILASEFAVDTDGDEKSIVIGDMEFDEEQEAWTVTITADKLMYVYNYTDFSSIAAEQNGYYVPYTMKLSKDWKDANATVSYTKSYVIDGAQVITDKKTYANFDGEMIVIIHGSQTVITYEVEVDGSTTKYIVTFDIKDFQTDATYDKAADGTKNPYGRAYTDDIGEVIYMVYANVNSAHMNELTGKAYYIGDKTEWDGSGEPVKTEVFTDTADNNTIDHTWYFNPVKDGGAAEKFEEGRYCLVIEQMIDNTPTVIAKAYVVYGTMASLIDVVEYEGEEIDSDYYVAEFAARVIENVGDAAYDYTVNMTGTLLHYVPANGTDKPGFYLVFQLNYGDKIITDNTSVIFDDASAKKVSTGVYRVYLGGDYSALAKPTFTVDIDGDEEVFASSSYIIETAGIDFPVMTIVLHDSYIGDDGAVDYEDVYANVKEGQPYRLPNGKDSSRVLDRWVFNGSTPEYAYDSIYMPKNVDADPETGYIEFTAVYKGSEPVPPQPQEDYSEDVSVAVNKVDGGVRVVVAAIDGKLVKGETITLFCEYWAEDEDGIMELVEFTLTGTVAGESVVTFTTIPTDGYTIAYMNAVYGDGLAESGVIVF